AAARDLVDHLAALTRRLAPWRSPPTIALAGGLIAHGGPLRDRLLKVLDEEFASRMAEAQHPGGNHTRGGEPSTDALRPRILMDPVDAARGAAALARSSTMQ